MNGFERAQAHVTNGGNFPGIDSFKFWNKQACVILFFAGILWNPKCECVHVNPYAMCSCYSMLNTPKQTTPNAKQGVKTSATTC